MNDRILAWGREFVHLPKRYAELMVEACRKKFQIGITEATKKVNSGFNEARIRARCRLRVRSSYKVPTKI